MRLTGWTRVIFIVIFVCTLAAALTYVNLQFTRTSAGGNDFLPRWVGTRLFLMERKSPYSPEATDAIQQLTYGRGAEGDEDRALFAYPMYSMIFFAPFALIENYPLARALWITTQEMALVATAVAAITVSGWKPGRWTLAAFLFFAIAWFHGAKPLVDGNASILVALLITMAMLAIKRNQDELAGILLALSTIKPQVGALLILFVLLWTLAKRRRAVLLSFVVTLGLLTGVSFILQPDWLTQNIAQVLVYSSYTAPGNPAGIFAEWWGVDAKVYGTIVSVVFLFVLLYEWWQTLSVRSDFGLFLWTASLTVVLGPLVGLPSTTSNYSIFLVVLALIFAMWQRRVKSQTAAWFNMALLFVGIWVLFLSTLEPGTAQLREHLSIFFVAPVFLLMNLYWLRWWLSTRAPELASRSR